MLEIEPTIIAQANAPLPKLEGAFGDPFANVGPPSNGKGKNGGIGNGDDRGVGNGKGPGVGPGEDGNSGGDVFQAGRGGVLSPVPLFKPDPEYSEEARKAKFQGAVRLQIVVDERGNPRDIRVIRPLGLGLDEKAIEAVKKWRFRAGRKDGKPVAVFALIDVNFRLL